MENRREYLLSLYREFPFDEGQLRIVNKAISMMTDEEVEGCILKAGEVKQTLLSTSALIKSLTK